MLDDRHIHRRTPQLLPLDASSKCFHCLFSLQQIEKDHSSGDVQSQR